jgi:phenylalanyl-tRNA synthetase beta chain
MKLTLSWLRDFAPIEGTPDEIGDQLTNLGMAVEEMAPADAGMDGIVVARVLDLRPHPDADRIQLVDVDAGDGEPLQICCGAFNMAVDDLVPLAPIGVTMRNGMEIARRKMRGEWSNGMICSAPEVGLGSDSEGILILPPELAPGALLADALGLAGDTWYELEINANRPDAMSVAGIARDLAAHQGVPFSRPASEVPRAGADATDEATVEIVDPASCGRFVARVLRGVRMDSSPLWLTTRLILGGMRPINRVVDVSNYVMLELGYPNHTYDLAKVAGARIQVRPAREGEQVTTLDEAERTLEAGDVVICDGDDQPIGVAGVMGGASTEISESTTDVLLEMAWWFPMQVARTSTRLALRSEASLRFERGADVLGIDLAMDRFCELMGGSVDSVASGQIDERGDLSEPAVIAVRPERVNAVLGSELTVEAMTGHLEGIGFQLDGVSAADGVLAVTAPSFRPDVSIEIDVIEEIARHHGYDHIERTVPGGVRFGALNAHQAARRQVRAELVGLGLSEAMPLPFLGDDDLDRAGLDAAGIGLSNPLDADASVLRTSLRPGLLKAIALNERHRQPGVRLFEVGRVFPPPPDGQQLPDEREQVAVILADEEAPAAVELVHGIVDLMHRPPVELRAATPDGLHPGRAAEIFVAGERIGLVGEVDPAVLEAYDVDERAAWLELDLMALVAIPAEDHLYRTVSRHPSSDIDLAFVVAEDVPAGDVEATIAEAAGSLLCDVALFDVYRGDNLGEGRRSLAFRLRFQAPDHTLTDEEVGERRQAVIAAVASEHGGELRG